MKINRTAFAVLCVCVGPFVMAENKDSYVQKADKQIQEWTDKLKALEKRSEKSGAHTREEFDRSLKVADEKLAVARKKLSNVRDSSEGTWEHLKRELDEAMRDVKHAWENAQSYFNKHEKKKEGAS